MKSKDSKPFKVRFGADSPPGVPTQEKTDEMIPDPIEKPQPYNPKLP